MEEPRASGRRQLSIVFDEDDFAELERIARARRSSVAQVVREFAAAGIDRTRRLEAAEVA